MAIFHVIPEGDLAIEGGDLVWLRGGPREVRQRIMARLRFFKGEWFLDTRLGIPYFQNVLVKSPNLPAIGAMLRRAILTTRGVIELVSFDLRFNETDRSLALTFHARTAEGDVIVSDPEPFIFAEAA